MIRAREKVCARNLAGASVALCVRARDSLRAFSRLYTRGCCDIVFSSSEFLAGALFANRVREQLPVGLPICAPLGGFFYFACWGTAWALVELIRGFLG